MRLATPPERSPQASQVGGGVHVVAHRQHSYAAAGFPQPSPRLPEGASRTPINAAKHLRRTSGSRPEADQVVATIAGRANDRVGAAQGGEGVPQALGRQRGAVGADDENLSVALRQEFAESPLQPCTQIVPALRPQPERSRQAPCLQGAPSGGVAARGQVEPFVDGRRQSCHQVGRTFHAGDMQPQRLLRGERGHETGFYASGLRLPGKNDQGGWGKLAHG